MKIQSRLTSSSHDRGVEFISIPTMANTVAIHPDFEASRAHRIERLSFAQNVLVTAQRQVPSGNQRIVSLEGLLPNDSLSLRPLVEAEIAALQTNGCSCTEWSKLRVLVYGKATLLLPTKLITNTRFDGTVVFVLSASEKSNDGIPYGVHGCRLVRNCILSVARARIYNCTLLADTFVEDGVTIMDCGSLTSSLGGPSTVSISIGAESGGGRRIQVIPEATLSDMSEQLQSPDGIRLTESHTCRLNIIGKHCDIRHTHRMESVFLHPNVRIVGASMVSNSVVLSQATIEHSSVTKCFLQWNATVSGHSTVSDCLIMEQASVGPSSIVAQSILAPDVHVSAGEIHASWLGPNCNAHHQSLLIGVIWPLGRGNVGYGANVGSNHTGRLPDQECTVGEGIFWGLSCAIKFPMDLSMAPYSIVAAGVQLGPLRCTMPFSLFVTDTSSNMVNILPGWVWKSSPYTISRSEAKFAKRRKAERHLSVTGWKILRPDIVELCRKARDVLQSNESVAAHVGNCTLGDAARTSGIQSYTSLIRMFALRGLLNFSRANEGDITMTRAAFFRNLENQLRGAKGPTIDTLEVSWPAFPWEQQTADSFWSYQKWLLLNEFPKAGSVTWEDWTVTALEQLLQLEVAFADRVYKCKRRDDERGSAIIPGYKESHVSAQDDPVVESTRTELSRKKDEINRILNLLTSSKSKL